MESFGGGRVWDNKSSVEQYLRPPKWVYVTYYKDGRTLFCLIWARMKKDEVPLMVSSQKVN